VSQPNDYLAGMNLYLASVATKDPETLYSRGVAGKEIGWCEVVGHVLVHHTTRIGPGCKLGPNVVIGQDCVLNHGVRMSHAAVMEGSHIKHEGCMCVCFDLTGAPAHTQ
jgi:mannose-1-phosphate guanylyltransferase